MGKVIASVVAWLCFGALVAPGQAWADDDGPGSDSFYRIAQCPLDQLPIQLSPSQIQGVRPDQIPGLSLSLREADGWPELAANEYGTPQQDLPTGEGSFASVSLLVYTAKDPRTLRDAFDDDHRHASTDAAAGTTEALVSDDPDDYQAYPSWFVRKRAEQRAGDILCSATEHTVREALVEHDGKTYLVQICGRYSWDYPLSAEDEPDPEIADKVADQVESGLMIEARR
ncbi:hypothetical protein [Segniliparus rugosus]|uniref:Uncharacterized protein n=1 Tax=Segniliparus rugosus (strain ATCC BAA-974 / DSM 45345 / CCUG 50838 / CIP 108380 / JCM 13579 / CDC 945) TaxID=679197 RepID=E5XKK1_SEGRC|nr:hypothetical protein [Segniliparus rugosus]EFV15113.1 hypothetical protein HMPREF9336_00020 [Segniliparus rugosus ATCC BAA-974]